MTLYISVDCNSKTFTVYDDNDEYCADYPTTDITIDEIIQHYQEESLDI